MTKYLLFVLLSIFICTSCTVITGFNITNLDENVKKINIGMTKNEIENLLSKKYYVASIQKTQDGTIEIIAYQGYKNFEYQFTFLDNKLIKLERMIYVPFKMYNESDTLKINN